MRRSATQKEVSVSATRVVHALCAHNAAHASLPPPAASPSEQSSCCNDHTTPSGRPRGGLNIMRGGVRSTRTHASHALRLLEPSLTRTRSHVAVQRYASPLRRQRLRIAELVPTSRPLHSCYPPGELLLWRQLRAVAVRCGHLRAAAKRPPSQLSLSTASPTANRPAHVDLRVRPLRFGFGLCAQAVHGPRPPGRSRPPAGGAPVARPMWPNQKPLLRKALLRSTV